ncbi:MAG: hypothetical protein MJB14_14255 [Spirochaetes bacterium]|nr:hypothetical protein [Spirochaetota bacterium]
MSVIKTKDLEDILENHSYNKIIIKGIHHEFYLIIIDKEGSSLIHSDNQGNHKKYRHVEQILEWLKRKYNICSVIIDFEKWEVKTRR